MPASGVLCSIDALLALDAAALDAAGLKGALRDVAVVRARLDAIEAAVLAEFDKRGAFVDDGAVNAASWLAHQTRVPRALAGGRVLLAKRLRRMPLMAKALARGSVTEAHARTMGRCLTPRTLEAFARDEALLVGQALELDADDFEITVIRWLQLNDVDGPDPGDERPSEFHASRHFGGRSRLDGDLGMEDTVEFLSELDAIYDELWRADQRADELDPDRHRSRSQRNAAALVEMARRSSSAGGRDADSDDDDVPRARPRRSLFVVVVDPAALAGDPRGVAELEDGSVVSPSILERWACDTGIGRVVMAGGSIPVDLGKVTYTPTNGQRRALIARDRGCIVPGCKRKPRWCEAHHVVPFPKGPTDLSNLALLCKRHHKHIHARIISLRFDPAMGRWVALRSDGTPLRQRPPPRAA